MAAAKNTQTVTLSASVNTKSNTFADIKSAKDFVGAPDSATVAVNGAPPVYSAPNTDPNAEVPESFPFSITFSWSEEK